MLQSLKSIQTKKLKIIFFPLALLTETSVNAEHYGGQSEVLVVLTAVFCKCQADTHNTDGNGYGQPQAVAERCDVTIPCHVGIFG
jgi:hypothetical protein